MIEGSCHCGKVRWTFDGAPERVTACNCTLCRRSGALWAHDYENERIQVTGETQTYIWGDRERGLHFCAVCGSIAYSLALAPDVEGRRRLSVNLRLADPDQVGQIPILRFDGFDAWEVLPSDGRVIADVWF